MGLMRPWLILRWFVLVLSCGEAAPFHAVNRDVNGDGQRDLVLRFQIQDLGIECGTTSLTLTGRVFHGQAVAGSSPIVTTGCHPKGANKPRLMTDDKPLLDRPRIHGHAALPCRI